VNRARKLLSATSLAMAMSLVGSKAAAASAEPVVPSSEPVVPTSEPHVPGFGRIYEESEAARLLADVEAAARRATDGGAEDASTIGDHRGADLPLRGDAPASLRSQAGGPTWSLRLPDALSEVPLHKDESSTIFQAADGAFRVVIQEVTAPQPGVRSVVIIDDATAPTRYEFDLDLPRGSTLSKDPDGGVEVVAPSGEPIAYVTPPWAVDARGDEVPTHYTVEGTTLVQVIDHANAAYPVMADPRVQADCGWTTCTLRFDRPTTHWIGYSGQSASAIAAGVCAYFSGGYAAACIAGIGVIGWVVSDNARDYYENGNCYGIRYARTGGPVAAWSHQVSAGDYNCRVGRK
jgi:hypothetical protein